ncbi:hypothetical protein ACFVVU_23755 [Kitasatospora sp. NPDC057965]|uniref:hypothetical protein n=1 Tax=Kitasatospora sp. NPDC057965 TaxID=3346291 RepID=UPI0036D93CA8
MPSSAPVPRYTYAQLHGTACIVCGGPGDLIPAGHAYTPTSPGQIDHGWAVRRHQTCHRPTAPEEEL